MQNRKDTLGDYLSANEPLADLWLELIDIVYRDSPRHGVTTRLTPPALTLFLVGCFEGEIINGGISQFFSNSAGDCSGETLDALQKIGARVSYGILKEALSLFPDQKAPTDRRERCALLFAFEERNPHFLKRLTRMFYDELDAVGPNRRENLTELQLTFMCANAVENVAV